MSSRSCCRRWSSRSRSSRSCPTASSADGRRSSSRTRSSTSPSSCGSSGRTGRTSIHASVRGGGDARGGAGGSVPRDHGAAARPGGRGGRGDRLPLLVHLVRHRPHPRRAALRDDRGGDLQPGRPALRPARRRRSLARSARLRRRGRMGRDAARTAGDDARAASRRARHAPARSDTPGQARRRRESRLPGALPRAAAGGSRRALARGRWRSRARCVPRARPADERPPRRPVGGGRELHRLRGRGNAIALVVGGLAAFAVSEGRNGHAAGSGPGQVPALGSRGRTRRRDMPRGQVRGQVPGHGRSGHARSTGSSCCRSACPP